MIPYIYITIPTYGIMAVFGAMVSISWAYIRSVKNEKYYICFQDFLILCLFDGIGCLVGSRLLFIITQIPYLVTDFSFNKLTKIFLTGGFVFYGGLFGAMLSNILFCKIKKYNLNDIMDFTIPMFVLFHIFGRIGCFLSGCCYGFKFVKPLIISNICLNYFPIQLVEVLFEIIIFLIIKKMTNGLPLKIYLLTYAIFRFFVEFFRGDAARGIWLGVSTSQWISIFIIVGYLYFIIKKNTIKSNLHS